jgi:rhodanese-related sulfurtransferase
MNKKRVIAIMLLLVALLVSGCAIDEPVQKSLQNTPVPSTAAVYQKIAASEALRIMEETDGYILLDVRTQEEFEQAHIKGAILLPDTEIKDKAEEQLKDKNAVILVYCRSGRRSAQAAQQLADMGYTKVNDFGGIIDWPYDTVSGTEVK